MAELAYQTKRPGQQTEGIRQRKAVLQDKRSTGMTGKLVDNRTAQLVQKPNASTQLSTGNTGLPDNLKSGIESLSGMSMDNVKVHYNSHKPAQLNAHAYAQGSDIHLAPGQEKHLPHEAWHVVQQAQGRVRPTMQKKGNVPVNDDKGLEREADAMGGRAADVGNRVTRRVTNVDVNKMDAVPVNSRQFSSRNSYFPSKNIISASDATTQLSEKGKWWGSTIGSALGTAVGAAAGYAYGTLSATTGAITGGISNAITGYQHGGGRGALVEGVGGAITGAFSGMSSGIYHGGMVGWTLGSVIGGSIGDRLTGPDAPPPQQLGLIARKMRANLGKLQTVNPTLDRAVSRKQSVAARSEGMSSAEIRLLNWMHDALGDDGFDEVSRGAQVRVPFHQGLFDRLIALGAQKRQSSHYSGTLFVSGFRQVVGEQYGTTGRYLPTVLFGKIQDRKGNFHMYFQPEGNAFNPDTGWAEKWRHVKDAGVIPPEISCS